MALDARSSRLIDHYLSEAIGPPESASLQRARALAKRGAVDLLVERLETLSPVTIATDSGINPSCVYVMRDDQGHTVSIWISTVLPYCCVALFRDNRFEAIDTLEGRSGWLGDLRLLLTREGLVLLDESVCRAPSPYLSDDGSRFDSYFEVLFEFDAYPPWEVMDPS